MVAAEAVTVVVLAGKTVDQAVAQEVEAAEEVVAAVQDLTKSHKGKEIGIAQNATIPTSHGVMNATGKHIFR